MAADISAVSSLRQQLFLNAICIDVTYGGEFAWTYLAKAGLKEDEILRLLIAPREAWHKVDNIQAKADLALKAVGMRPHDYDSVVVNGGAIGRLLGGAAEREA
jgi:hypothetical protein